jgi:hypothetical protein
MAQDDLQFLSAEQSPKKADLTSEVGLQLISTKGLQPAEAPASRYA